jgi:hypothetical protein
MNELTTTETNRLETLEHVIQKGVNSFLRVGAALAEISESRLYRAQYDSFEAYCQERWNFTADYGRKLTRAVEAVASLPDDMPKPTTASHARALADVPEERRADVWREACEEAETEDREVTAVDIRRAAEEDAEEDDSWATQSLGEANMAEVAPHVKAVLEALSKASQAAEALSKTSAREWLLVGGGALLKHIRDARDQVNAAKPAGVCPYCGGEGCKKCLETGWVNKTRMDQKR